MKRSAYLILFVALPASVLAVAAGSRQSENEECYRCHRLPEVPEQSAGKDDSFQIDEVRYAESIHGGFTCQDCHFDVEGFPHRPKPQEVECTLCHSEEGPVGDSEEDVIYAWEHLPRRLTWSERVPSEPGWYWLQDRFDLVWVKKFVNVEFFTHKPIFKDNEYAPVKFAGPIAQPITQEVE